MNVSAVTICREPVPRDLPGVPLVHSCGHRLRSAAEVCQAWLDSIDLVDTEWFFWLDSDDELPADYLDVLAECQRAEAALAYTDELVVEPDGGEAVRRRRPYSAAAHLEDPMLLHHLVLCRTEFARAARGQVPRGHYWPEMPLFWVMAQAGGAHYVPRVGYRWRRSADGLSRQWWTSVAQMRSRLWCKEH